MRLSVFFKRLVDISNLSETGCIHKMPLYFMWINDGSSREVVGGFLWKLRLDVVASEPFDDADVAREEFVGVVVVLNHYYQK